MLQTDQSQTSVIVLINIVANSIIDLITGYRRNVSSCDASAKNYKAYKGAGRTSFGSQCYTYRSTTVTVLCTKDASVCHISGGLVGDCPGDLRHQFGYAGQHEEGGATATRSLCRSDGRRRGPDRGESGRQLARRPQSEVLRALSVRDCRPDTPRYGQDSLR